ncbi:type II toxin-antitoxin system mRNA interferase toxin, RelE/StbE family [Candidatus Collierbacteria bacterium]|nr:type II toxin-antitoxin system mRNA interferase toxin, RelE/StbE family [Candidatus Collierbacteria bacterium]
MKFRIAIALDRRLQKLFKTNSELSVKIEKQLRLFSQDHRHPSLKTHKLSGKLDNLWSISITKSLRMTYILDKEEAIFTDFGTHDQVYKQT